MLLYHSESSSDSVVNTREDEHQLNAYQVAQYLTQSRQHFPNMAEQQHMNELYRNYTPALNYNQNPIYYEANRILFEAHQERISRLQALKSRS